MNSLFTKRPLDYYLLWIAVLVSLGINVYLVNALVTARRQVGEAAVSAAAAVGDLSQTAIDYMVPIREALPVSFTVAYQHTFVIPISVTVPIDTVVSVPLNTPLGTFPINIPVKTSIPIRLQQEVPLNLAVPVSETVPISIDVPIHIALSDTALGQSLAGAQQYLNNLAVGLGALTPTPTPTPTPTDTATPTDTSTPIQPLTLASP